MTLPPLPPRPTDAPTPNVPVAQWEAAWRVYWQAAAVHAAAESTETLAQHTGELRRKTLDEVILHCAALTPRNDGERDATWAGRVVARGKALHGAMQ